LLLLLLLCELQSEDDEDEEGEDMADDGLQVIQRSFLLFCLVLCLEPIALSAKVSDKG
jgi:hypothetical protein